MGNLKTKWWKAALIIIGSGFINFVLHGLLSPLNSSNTAMFEPSIFIRTGMLIPAIIVWELLAFGILALVYFLIQDKLPGKKGIKGFIYGLSIGGLYFIGMFEMVLLANNSVYGELLMGLTDCITFMMAGFLLGTFIGTDRIEQGKRDGFAAVFVIAALFLAGRYFAYGVLQISSAYITKPVGTFAWTLCLGLWIGVIYFYLQAGIQGKSIVSQGLFFGMVILGSNWLMNHVFIYTVAEFSFDLLVRVGIDVLFASIGVYAYKKLQVKSSSKLNKAL